MCVAMCLFVGISTTALAKAPRPSVAALKTPLSIRIDLSKQTDSQTIDISDDSVIQKLVDRVPVFLCRAANHIDFR